MDPYKGDHQAIVRTDLTNLCSSEFVGEIDTFVGLVVLHMMHARPASFLLILMQNVTLSAFVVGGLLGWTIGGGL
jgi:hypothetical protein